MVKLKDKVNKTKIMGELLRDAEIGYHDSWQSELQIEAYMNGAERLFNLLRLPIVSKNEDVCNCDNEHWKEDEGGDWYCTIHNV